MGCGKEGQVKLMKSAKQNISAGVVDEIRRALMKDHLQVVVETAR